MITVLPCGMFRIAPQASRTVYFQLPIGYAVKEMLATTTGEERVTVKKDKKALCFTVKNKDDLEHFVCLGAFIISKEAE